jgi:hypothetical protein
MASRKDQFVTVTIVRYNRVENVYLFKIKNKKDFHQALAFFHEKCREHKDKRKGATGIDEDILQLPLISDYGFFDGKDRVSISINWGLRKT